MTQVIVRLFIAMTVTFIGITYAMAVMPKPADIETWRVMTAGGIVWATGVLAAFMSSY